MSSELLQPWKAIRAEVRTQRESGSDLADQLVDRRMLRTAWQNVL